jgi:hypothetical protein
MGMRQTDTIPSACPSAHNGIDDSQHTHRTGSAGSTRGGAPLLTTQILVSAQAIATGA